MASTGRLEPGLHSFPVRVYYEDTDAAGLVYHANYLKFAERARTEIVRALGADHRTLRERHGATFVLADCAMRHLRPARLDDLIEVRTTLTDVTGATLSLAQNIWRGEEALVEIDVRLACIDAAGRAVRIPAEARTRLAEWGWPEGKKLATV